MYTFHHVGKFKPNQVWMPSYQRNDSSPTATVAAARVAATGSVTIESVYSNGGGPGGYDVEYVNKLGHRRSTDLLTFQTMYMNAELDEEIVRCAPTYMEEAVDKALNLVNIAVRLDADTVNKLDSLAQHYGMIRPALIREILTHVVSRMDDHVHA